MQISPTIFTHYLNMQYPTAMHVLRQGAVADTFILNCFHLMLFQVSVPRIISIVSCPSFCVFIRTVVCNHQADCPL